MTKVTMREAQMGALEILKKIDQICQEQNLMYYLAYGTLIGAIRHKGFIPWDDDVDIMMPRADYEQLLEYFENHREELLPYEILNNRNCEKYPYMISRVSDSRYCLDVSNEEDYGIGLFVDIYPLDGLASTQKESQRIKKRASRYVSLCYLSTRQKIRRENTNSRLRYALKFPAFAVAKLIGKNRIMNKIDEIAKKCNYNASQYIGCVIWASDDGEKGVFPKKWFEDSVDVKFEDAKFKAPKEYDSLLKQLYGNYLQMPPEEKQIAHHYYDAYRK